MTLSKDDAALAYRQRIQSNDLVAVTKQIRRDLWLSVNSLSAYFDLLNSLFAVSTLESTDVQRLTRYQQRLQMHMEHMRRLLTETFGVDGSEFNNDFNLLWYAIPIVSHDIRNPLVSIMGYADLFAMFYANAVTPSQILLSQRMTHIAESVRLTSQRMCVIFDACLQIAREQPPITDAYA